MMRPKGYTLIEIILVIALISIFLGIALPSTKILSYLKEDKELEEFRKDLLYCRNRAIIECTNYNVYLDYDNNSYYITSKGSKSIIKRKYFQHGIRYKKSYNSTSFTFTSSGSPSSTGTIYLVNSRKSEFELAVSPVTGRVRLTKVK